MKVRCVIVDDEPLARKLLEQHVSKLPTLELLASLPSAIAALDFLKGNEVDLMFLDVQMPELTGVGLLKVLRHKPLVVLTTAYSDYAVEGYALDVADYLLKPITFERFAATVEKLIVRLSAKRPPRPPEGEMSTLDAAISLPETEAAPEFLFVKDGHKSVRVALRDIQYIEGLKDYVRIHTPERTITSLQSLRHLMEVLPKGDFLRVHHSTIVGVAWVEEVHRDEIRVAGAMLTVSDKYRTEVKGWVAGREL